MNYIIASYAGTNYEYSLELQMQNLFTILLNKKTTLLKQVTIVCPEVKPQHTRKQFYYNWDKWIYLFQTYLPHINLIYMDYVGKNLHASYDQWIQAILKFPDFDYFLLVEDDYCIHPSVLDFDTQLVDTYNTIAKGGLGYVCTYADAIMGHHYHAAISNGIVNRKTIEKFKDKGVDLLEQYYKCASDYGIEQVGFSDLFLKNDIPVYSLHNNYKALFWSSYRNKVECFSKNDVQQFLFIPIQFLTNL